MIGQPTYCKFDKVPTNYLSRASKFENNEKINTALFTETIFQM